jgi:hypothetical protein
MSLGTVFLPIAALLFELAAVAQSRLEPGPTQQAPPPAVPAQQLPVEPGSPPVRKPLGTTPYSIGQPTDEEQLYLEYLNRMRATPTAEGQRLATTTDPNVIAAYSSFQVDLNLMQMEFTTNRQVPPLAMNSELLNAARWHSGDMFTNQYQGHFQTNGSLVLSPANRIATNGYKASAYGENVYSYADSVFHGHAAFAVDWGGPVGGMQDPTGHRDNMFSPLFREVGIGVVDGSNGSVGPQLVTQDFGAQDASPIFITGVVYFDLNGSGFYDVGEGIGGVMVNSPGSTYFAVTADSGGYAIPVQTNGSYALTFTAPGLSNQSMVTISGFQNAKIDYAPPYSPPTISGPNPAALNQNNTYTITPVAGATGYRWQQALLTPYGLIEGAETGLSNVTALVSGYPVITTEFAASGTHSFQLEHAMAVDQSLTLNPILLVTSNSQLSFAEMLGFALTNEVAQAQVSTDSGKSWTTVWSKPGNDGNSAVDSAFVQQTISLGAYAGQTLQVRFVFAFLGGLYFNSGTDLGLYLDNIAVSNAEQLSSAVTNTVSSNHSFTFSPTSVTNYLLEVSAQINSRVLPWGPAFAVGVTTAAGTPEIQLNASPTISGGQIQIDFTITNYRAGMTLQLLRSTDLRGAWLPDTSATIQTVVPNSRFRFTTSTGAAQNLFFRIKGA